MSDDRAPQPRNGWWWKCLAAGLALWLASAAVTLVIRNATLMPTVILLGSFLVPCCVVLFVVERTNGDVPLARIVVAFVVGGVCGVLGASLLEGALVANLWIYLGVGLIEEGVKGVVLIVVGWPLARGSARTGALLGATVGAGFAAFESAGYAYDAAAAMPGLGVAAVMQTEGLRALLAPAGHVLWSAILGAVLFRAARPRPWSIRRAHLVVAYLAVSALHAAWDSMDGITQILGMLLSGGGLHVHRYVQFFARTPHRGEATAIAGALYPAGLLIVTVLGVWLLWTVLRRPSAVVTEPAA